jgi:hypothetical protein
MRRPSGFLATPHEVAPGEQPDYELRTTTSVHGVTGWSTPTVCTTPFPEQGLWWIRSAQPSADRSDWTEPVRLLDTGRRDTPDWMGRGVCDPAAISTADGTLTVFVSGTRRYRNWAALAIRQLRRRQRLPVPAPFYLCTAVLRLPLDDPLPDRAV